VKPALVTFDCAQTLIAVDWRVGDHAVSCAEHCGLEVHPSASSAYEGLYHERLKEYREVNLTRDRAQCEAFWDRITYEWIVGMCHDPQVWVRKMRDTSKKLGFGPDSSIFKVYSDVIPCLAALKSQGIQTAIISNWDYSLHGILEVMQLDQWFDVVIASLEEGFEKPDPRIFHLVLDRLGISPEDALHVGDDPIDDLKGARDVGMRAVLIDRNRTTYPVPPYIASLSQLQGAFAWSS